MGDVVRMPERRGPWAKPPGPSARPPRRFRRLRFLTVPWRLVIGGGVIAGLIGVMFATSPYAPLDTVRHYLSAPNCAAARAMGLTPSRRGQPGYWPGHDADADGVACEWG